MTKIEYVDFICNSLQMVDKTAKFHKEQVAAAINNAVNTVFYEMYARNPKSVRKSMDRYTVGLTSLAVAYPLGANPRYTSTLTFDIVNLPTKCAGIIEIVQLNINATTLFVPVTVLEGRQLYGSEASLPGNVIGYTLLDNRTIEYWGMDSVTADAGVYARLIKQFKEFADTDDLLLPYGQDERIMELVRQYLGMIPPKDLINTNADGQYK